MARRTLPAKRADEPGDDYRCAQTFRGFAKRLAVPASDDPAHVHRCRQALEGGYREADRARDWPGRVDAMAAAFADVYGEVQPARLRASYAAELLVGDPSRREAYVSACGRQFKNDFETPPRR